MIQQNLKLSASMTSFNIKFSITQKLIHTLFECLALEFMIVFQAFSQFERDLIFQRTKEGLNQHDNRKNHERKSV